MRQTRCRTWHSRERRIARREEERQEQPAELVDASPEAEIRELKDEPPCPTPPPTQKGNALMIFAFYDKTNPTR
jgi:hypothetical protein